MTINQAKDKDGVETNFVVIGDVIALYPRIDQTYKWSNEKQQSVPCAPTADGAAYDTQFRMDEETAKALYKTIKTWYLSHRKDSWPEKLPMPFDTKEDADGTKYYIGKSRKKGAYDGEATYAPRQYDSANVEIKDEKFMLTTGSVVSIAAVMVPYCMFDNNKEPEDWGVSLRLTAVQVTKLAAASVSSPFGAVEGGFTSGDDDSPFGGTAPTEKKAEEKASTEDDDDDAFPDTEPKKKAPAKSESSPPEDEKVLDSVIDEWDD